MASETRNIVVIGLGLAGANVVTALVKALPDTHRIVAITEKPFGYWPTASMRASVVPGWEDKTTLSNAGIIQKGSRHVLLAGTKVVSIDKDLHTLHVDTAHPELGFAYEIPFEYAIVATGSAYSFPARPPRDARTMNEVVAAHRMMQRGVAAASSILVVGAGNAGIEFASEVAVQHPKKTVYLVTSASTLYGGSEYKEKVGRNAASQLVSLGIKIVFNTRLDTRGLATGPIPPQLFTFEDESSATVDFVMLATGNKVNSDLVQALDSQAVDNAGYIKVLDTLQLVNPAFSHIYAVGDCTDRPERKAVGSVLAQVPIVTANILAALQKTSVLKSHIPSKLLFIVSIGPSGGVGQMWGWYVGSWISKFLKSKGLFLFAFRGLYPVPK